MGYQESWLIVKPQRKVRRILELALRSDSYARVASVVILKKDIENIRKGTKIFWIVGDRWFHSLAGILNGNKMTSVSNKVIPVEEIIQDDDLIDGLGLSYKFKFMTENQFMKRYDPYEFLWMGRKKEREDEIER